MGQDQLKLASVPLCVPRGPGSFVEQRVSDPFLTHVRPQKGPFSRHFGIFGGPRSATMGSKRAKTACCGTHVILACLGSSLQPAAAQRALVRESRRPLRQFRGWEPQEGGRGELRVDQVPWESRSMPVAGCTQ